MTNVDYSIKDLKGVLKNIDGVIKEVKISRLTGLGENYVSLVLRVDAEVEKNGERKTVKAVAKCLPPSGGNPMSHRVMGNEIKWYAEIVPLLKKSGKELGINTDFYPEFLGGRFSLDPNKTEIDTDAVLILKNINPEGYQNEDRHKGFDLSTTKAILTSLANFHALPLALKFKKPELFKTLKAYMDSTRHVMPPPPPKDGQAQRRGGPPIGKLFDKLLELPQCKPYKANIEALKLKSNGPKDWHNPGPEPWNTVVHGDFWINNIMIKPREAELPLVKIVDFQVCSYASFTKDLVFFLFTSLKSELMVQEFDNLLRYYYDQLTSILDKLRIPELNLSYEDYLAAVKRQAGDGEVGHAIFFTTPIFGEKGKGPDLLAENVDLFDHFEYTVNNMSDKHKEVLGIIIELSVKKGWI